MALGLSPPLAVKVEEGAHEEEAGRGHVYTAGKEDPPVLASPVQQQTCEWWAHEHADALHAADEAQG